MIKKSHILFTVLFALLFFVLLANYIDNSKNQMLKVESVPLYSSSGWGYNILVDHKIFIHQEYIPAIAGKKAFCSKEDALKTADLVIEKMKNKKLPAITKDDLAALKISL